MAMHAIRDKACCMYQRWMSTSVHFAPDQHHQIMKGPGAQGGLSYRRSFGDCHIHYDTVKLSGPF